MSVCSSVSKQEGVGAHGLKHAAADFSEESSDLNKAAVSARWLREKVGLGVGMKNDHRLLRQKGSCFLYTSKLH